jgi:RNA polymerase sigma-70 factor (ECF subfamily)
MVSAVDGEMLAAIPQLRAFAVALCRNVIMQTMQTISILLRACDNIAKFAPSTNMRAWLITILRNQFYSEYRKRRRDIQGADEVYTRQMLPSQIRSTARNIENSSRRCPDCPKRCREPSFWSGARRLLSGGDSDLRLSYWHHQKSRSRIRLFHNSVI